MRMRIFIIVILTLISEEALSQKDTLKYCNPKLEGMARSKAFYILYERAFASDVNSNSKVPGISDSMGTIKTNNKFDIDLKLPVWVKPALKIVLGFRYFYQEFKFKSPQDLQYALYRNLQDKPLKSIGTNLTILKSIKETNYILFRTSWELNGDYSAKEFAKSSFLKYTVAIAYGWKPCATRTTALGLYYSYTFGRKAIVPLFIYNNTFTKKWGLEAIFPIDVRMRHNFSEKTLLYVGYDIQGTPYHIKLDNPTLSTYQSLELRRSTLRLLAEFNQEIYDWLWLGITGGLVEPVTFNLVKSPAGRRKDIVIQNNVNPTGFFNISLFIVPPRTLDNKLLNGKDQ